jgi:hypothetical protein
LNRYYNFILENTGDLYHLEPLIMDKKKVFKTTKIAEFKEAVDLKSSPDKSLLFISNLKGVV